eukprot:TRINITY_DN17794_c0_g1_i1.p1 TRINITY_DN17794_c0_g1~~TRINITY_DN17794_c0_g1_i1.p1  ORF type:complete len:808 (+),score=196.83 TRINITY_DN17794_c0_g1_i1:44-2467(+)
MDELVVRGSPVMVPTGSKSSESGDSALKRTRSSSTITPPTPDMVPNRSRTSSLIIADGKEANRRRRNLPLAGISKVLADATRVAEALGKAQQARTEREDRAMGIIRDIPVLNPPEESPAQSGSKDTDNVVQPVTPPSFDAAREEEPSEPLLVPVACDDEALQQESEHVAVLEPELEPDLEPEHETVADGDNDEIPIEEINLLCDERVEYVLSGEYEKGDQIREMLWRHGVLLDDTSGVWTASNGMTGEYEALGALSRSPSRSPGVKSGNSQSPLRIQQIDDKAYQRLLGKQIKDDEVVLVQADRDMRREEEMRRQTHVLYHSPPRTSASPNTKTPSPEKPSMKHMEPGERLYFAGAAREQLKQDKLQQERESKILEEMSRLSRGPVITSKAKSVKGGFAQRQAEWASKVKASKDDALTRKNKENTMEDQENRRVAMSKKSEELTRDRAQGPVKNWGARFEKHCKTRSPAKADPYMFKPNITSTASNLHRKGCSGDRLYNDAAMRAMKHEQRVNKATEKAQYDKTTGKPRYTPSITSKHTSPPPSPPSQVRGGMLFTRVSKKQENPEPDAVIHRLLSQGQQAERRRLQKESLKNESKVHKSKLSKTTQEIVSRIERKPLYETHSKEQEGGVQHGAVLFSKGHNSVGGASTSYAASVADSERSVATEQFATRSAMHEKQRRMKLEKLRKSKADAEMQACTFTPTICNASHNIFKKAGEKAGVRSVSADCVPSYQMEQQVQPPQYDYCDYESYGEACPQEAYHEEVYEEDETFQDGSLYHYNDYVTQPHTTSAAEDALLNWRRLSSSLDA